MAFLTDRTLATGVTSNDLIHIVITGDTSQNPAGSSYKATMGQVLDLINPTTLTGGTYNPITGTITFYDDNGGSFNVTGLVTGYTNTAVTGLTYDNANTFTILENDGTTHSATFNVVTGLTVNGDLLITGTTSSGTISATTYQNLPTDVRVTGATYSNNIITFTNNTGGTFNVLFNTFTGATINGNLTTTGKTITSTFQLTSGATNGYFLISDGSGNATWSSLSSLSGSSILSTTQISASTYTATTSFSYFGVTFTGNTDITIPSASGITGYTFRIKDEKGNCGSYRIRVTPSSGTIDGNSYVDMNINYMSLTFVARNNNWWII